MEGNLYSAADIPFDFKCLSNQAFKLNRAVVGVFFADLSISILRLYLHAALHIC